MEEEERQNLDNIINQIYGIKLKSPDLLKGYKKRLPQLMGQPFMGGGGGIRTRGKV